jgi:peptidoglycan/LPS O-acetylase OafA/YrhL
LLYFANYYIVFFDPNCQTLPGGTGILWSLAVEEHFYIFFPLLMTIFVRGAWRPLAIGTVLIVACVGILLWRVHLVQSPDFFSDRTYLASDTRIDSIIYGCLAAFLANPLRSPRALTDMSLVQWIVFSTGIGVLIFSLIYRDPAFRETLRYSLQGIALLPIFYFAIRFHDKMPFRPLNTAWAIRIGTYSYAIYLVHQIVIMAIEKNVPSFSGDHFFIFAVTLMISVAYAAVIDRFVDPYFRQLRRRYRSAKPSSVPAAPYLREPLRSQQS